MVGKAERLLKAAVLAKAIVSEEVRGLGHVVESVKFSLGFRVCSLKCRV